MITTKFKIQGMHCASCKALIEEVCQEALGVSSCDVDLETEIATVTHSEETDMNALQEEIKGLGDYVITSII